MPKEETKNKKNKDIFTISKDIKKTKLGKMPRKCKQQSNIPMDDDNDKITIDNDIKYDYGVCCFCGELCNPASQSCGICARKL